MERVKQITVISGKGGTGKTSLTASLALLAGSDAVIADCDVDASNMYLLMEPVTVRKYDFYSGFRAEIDPDKCSGCGVCMTVCHFDAITPLNDFYEVSPRACEGCGYCKRVCPDQAIDLLKLKSGEVFVSRTRMRNILVHARLGIASDMSGKLVTEVRREAKKVANENQAGLILIDGSPGIGCPVTASLTGADFAVVVTEPTKPAFHDLQRVITLVQNLRMKSGILINKKDINATIVQQIYEYAKTKGIPVLTELPYDAGLMLAINEGKSMLEVENIMIRNNINKLWKDIRKLTGDK